MPRLFTSAFFLVCLILPVAAALSPRPGEAVAVLSLPALGGSPAADAVAAAGGQLLDMLGGGRVAIARSDEPGFAKRLYAAGALLVFRAGSSGCATLKTADLS